MIEMINTIRFGTCSWKYHSWVGILYSSKKTTAVEYLTEYATHYTTAEIDSWFYKIPSMAEVKSYKNAVDRQFHFTCKIPQKITLTHDRQKNSNGSLTVNNLFLSPELFKTFLSAIEPLLPQIDALMFEFEYLNKQKMGSFAEFQNKLIDFFSVIPSGLPYAVECRNSNYLKPAYFEFLQTQKLIPVFSEKMYMPHIYEVYTDAKEFIQGSVVIRLLGEDRKKIEEKTNEQWNHIVDEKNDKDAIVEMMKEIAQRSSITCNVNNHYEGSAPLTIESLVRKLKE